MKTATAKRATRRKSPKTTARKSKPHSSAGSYGKYNTPEFTLKVKELKVGESINYPGGTVLQGKERQRVLSALRSKYYRGEVRRSVTEDKKTNHIVIRHDETK